MVKAVASADDFQTRETRDKTSADTLTGFLLQLLLVLRAAVTPAVPQGVSSQVNWLFTATAQHRCHDSRCHLVRMCLPPAGLGHLLCSPSWRRFQGVWP